MKTLLFCLFIAVPTGIAHAASASTPAVNARLRQDAIALLRQGKPAESKQLVSTIAPGANRSSGNAIEIGQQWTVIAFRLRSSGESSLARQAAAEAVAIATSLVRASDLDPVRSSFLSSAGLACERILGDLPRSKTLYEAALVANPSNTQAKQRNSLADAKLKERIRRKGQAR
jgi:hypothetical protein